MSVQTLTKHKCKSCHYHKPESAFAVINGQLRKSCEDCLSKRRTYIKPAKGFTRKGDLPKVVYGEGWEEKQPLRENSPEFKAYKSLIESVFTEDAVMTIRAIHAAIGWENVRREWTMHVLDILVAEKFIDAERYKPLDTYTLRTNKTEIKTIKEPLVQTPKAVMDAISIQCFGKGSQERRKGWMAQTNNHLFENDKFVPMPLD